jgi:hypothetical protein
LFLRKVSVLEFYQLLELQLVWYKLRSTKIKTVFVGLFSVFVFPTEFLEFDFVFGSFLYSYLNELDMFDFYSILYNLIVYLIGHFTLDLLFIMIFYFSFGLIKVF